MEVGNKYRRVKPLPIGGRSFNRRDSYVEHLSVCSRASQREVKRSSLQRASDWHQSHANRIRVFGIDLPPCGGKKGLRTCPLPSLSHGECAFECRSTAQAELTGLFKRSRELRRARHWDSGRLWKSKLGHMLSTAKSFPALWTTRN